MADVAWIAERIHWKTTREDVGENQEPLCAQLTGVVDVQVTSDKSAVTCDACRAMDLAKLRGRYLKISLGLVTKEVLRFGVACDARTLANIEKISDTPGVTPLEFFVDSGNLMLWLVVAADDKSVIRRLLDTVDLSTKSHGEFYA